MSVLTTAKADRDALAAALAGDSLALVCLCAAWCDTCREFRIAFAQLAAAHADVAFVWIDIEDDAALAGDIDVENFPTLLVQRQGRVLHFGASLPHPAGVGRLVDAMRERRLAANDVPDAVTALAGALASGY